LKHFATILSANTLFYKQWRDDGTLSGYPQIKNFQCHTATMDGREDFFDLLDRLEREPNRILVRGHCDLPDGEFTERNNLTIKDVPKQWIWLDLDKVDFPEQGMTKNGALEVLHDHELDGYDCHFSWSSSTGHPTRGYTVSAHVGMWLDQPRTCEELRRWAKVNKFDLSPFKQAQVLYTSAPDKKPYGMDARSYRFRGEPFIELEIPEYEAEVFTPTHDYDPVDHLMMISEDDADRRLHYLRAARKAALSGMGVEGFYDLVRNTLDPDLWARHDHWQNKAKVFADMKGGLSRRTTLRPRSLSDIEIERQSMVDAMKEFSRKAKAVKQMKATKDAKKKMKIQSEAALLETNFVYMMKVTTGLGKTSNMMKVGDDYHWSAPRISLMEDMGAPSERIFRGRLQPDPQNPGQTMCRKPSQVREIASLETSIRHNLCASCEFREECRYLDQFDMEGSIYAAHNFLSLTPPWHHKHTMRVIDENPIGSFLQHTHVNFRNANPTDVTKSINHYGDVDEGLQIIKRYADKEPVIIDRKLFRLLGTVARMWPGFKNARTWARLFDILADGGDMSDLTWYQDAVTIDYVKPFKDKIPTIYLDATLPSDALLSAMFPKQQKIKKQFTAKEKIKIDLIGLSGNTKQMMDNPQFWEKYVVPWIDDSKPCLVVSTKEVEEYIKETFQLPDCVAWEHYGNLSGLDCYGDFEQMVIYGKQAPSINLFRGQARAIERECGGSLEDYQEGLRYLSSEAQIEQAIGRLRAVNKAKDARVLSLTTLPAEMGYDVSSVTIVEDIRDTSVNRLWALFGHVEEQKSKVFYMSPKLAFKFHDAGKFFRNERDFKNAIDRYFPDEFKSEIIIVKWKRTRIRVCVLDDGFDVQLSDQINGEIEW